MPEGSNAEYAQLLESVYTDFSGTSGTTIKFTKLDTTLEETVPENYTLADGQASIINRPPPPSTTPKCGARFILHVFEGPADGGVHVKMILRPQ